MIHVLPHWNWAGHEGQDIPVMAYSNADEVELIVNGKSLGRKKRFGEEFIIPVGRNISDDLKFATKYRFVWTVPYQPGSLKAVAYRDGKQVAIDEIRTAGPPARITLAADRNAIRADGDDLSYITVKVEDREGNLCPMADNLIHFAITGPAAIAAVDNGNAATVEPFQADQRKAFSGLALVILRSKPAEAGRARLIATSDGLAQAAIEITTSR
jgi:beta-galactosidase